MQAAIKTIKPSHVNPLEVINEKQAEQEADEISDVKEDSSFKMFNKVIPHSMSIKTTDNRATGTFDF